MHFEILKENIVLFFGRRTKKNEISKNSSSVPNVMSELPFVFCVYGFFFSSQLFSGSQGKVPKVQYIFGVIFLKVTKKSLREITLMQFLFAGMTFGRKLHLI